MHFRVPSLFFDPLVAKYLAENGFPERFEKTISPIHFIPTVGDRTVALNIDARCLITQTPTG